MVTIRTTLYFFSSINNDSIAFLSSFDTYQCHATSINPLQKSFFISNILAHTFSLTIFWWIFFINNNLMHTFLQTAFYYILLVNIISDNAFVCLLKFKTHPNHQSLQSAVIAISSQPHQQSSQSHQPTYLNCSFKKDIFKNF